MSCYLCFMDVEEYLDMDTGEVSVVTESGLLSADALSLPPRAYDEDKCDRLLEVLSLGGTLKEALTVSSINKRDYIYWVGTIPKLKELVDAALVNRAAHLQEKTYERDVLEMYETGDADTLKFLVTRNKAVLDNIRHLTPEKFRSGGDINLSQTNATFNIKIPEGADKKLEGFEVTKTNSGNFDVAGAKNA